MIFQVILLLRNCHLRSAQVKQLNYLGSEIFEISLLADKWSVLIGSVMRMRKVDFNI